MKRHHGKTIGKGEKKTVSAEPAKTEEKPTEAQQPQQPAPPKSEWFDVQLAVMRSTLPAPMYEELLRRVNSMFPITLHTLPSVLRDMETALRNSIFRARIGQAGDVDTPPSAIIVPALADLELLRAARELLPS